MEQQTNLIIFLSFAIIVLVSFGFYMLSKSIFTIRQELEAEKKKNDFYHFEVMNRLKMLCVSELTFLRDSCIKQERYEDAQRITDILEKDMKDSLLPEYNPKKENKKP